MIRRKEEIRIRKVENAMGGKGCVYFHDWLLPEEAPNHGRVFSKVVIPAGSSIGYHKHTGEFEAYYVAQGVGLVTDGEEQVEVHVGDMNLCRNGESHGVENIGEEDLILSALIMKDLA